VGMWGLGSSWSLRRRWRRCGPSWPARRRRERGSSPGGRGAGGVSGCGDQDRRGHMASTRPTFMFKDPVANRAAGSRAAARSSCRPSGGTSFGRSASRLFNAIPTRPPTPVNHSLVGDGGGQGDGQLPRRDPALGAGAALSGAQGAGEGDPVGIQPGVSRGGGHQGRARRSAGTGSRRPLGGRRRGSSSGARPSGRAGGS